MIKFLTNWKTLIIVGANILSLLVLTISLSVIKPPEQVLAENNNSIEATWQVSKCVMSRSGGRSGVNNIVIPLGPAGWRVTYNLPNNKNITENWVVTKWRYVGGGSSNYFVQNGECPADPVAGMSGKVDINSGPYSQLCRDCDKSHPSSAYPMGWNVTTTYN